jgi:Pyridoxal-dependent decarboxylase, pyridoxal binding domain
MTERIHEFLRHRREDGPCLVVDLEVVRDNYKAFANALPDTRVFYAVKANPSPEVLSLLARMRAICMSGSKVRRRKGGTYPLSHLYGHFGLVRLSRLGHDVSLVKA